MFIVKHLEKIYEPNTRMQALVTSWHDNEYLLRRVLDVVYLWRRGDFKFLEIKLRTRHLPGLGASTAHGHCRFSAPFNPPFPDFGALCSVFSRAHQPPGWAEPDPAMRVRGRAILGVIMRAHGRASYLGGDCQGARAVQSFWGWFFSRHHRQAAALGGGGALLLRPGAHL